MVLGKKAVFFTFIAVMLLSVLILSMNINQTYRLRESIFVTESRIGAMDRFIDDIEDDISRGVYISGFRALVGIEDHITVEGDYITNINPNFYELFINGTLDGANSSIMLNNTFKDWMEKMKSEAEKTDIILNFTLNSVNISQNNPWTILVDTEVYIDITDERNTSHWSKLENVLTNIEIDGFEDPFYRIETNGVYSSRIEKSNYSYFVSGTDITNLLDHVSHGYYVAFPGAPSYLMRLQGNFSSSEYGIESLVEVDNLPSEYQHGGSIVDYYYFGNDDPSAYHVSGAPTWFRIDNQTNMYGNQTHIQSYQVGGLT